MNVPKIAALPVIAAAVLACSACVYDTAAEPAAEPAAAAVPTTPASFDLAAGALFVNVMKGVTPKLPAFPRVTPRRGHVRGYVFDSQGKPLQGAEIGVRSTAGGGYYSGASSKTDARGFYEVRVPWGAADFYCAGFTIDYGDGGRAAMGLHPADGDAGSFASERGAVENWVLLPFGTADRDAASEKPSFSSSYYGGALVLNWRVDDGAPYNPPNYLKLGSKIEVTLTPDGPLIDGSRGRAFTIRKPVEESGLPRLQVLNLPIGRYKFAARLLPAGGGAPTPLRIRESGPQGGMPFGLSPKEGTGEAALLFRPNSAKAGMVPGQYGNWDGVSIELDKP